VNKLKENNSFYSLGVKENVIPATASAIVNLRVHPKDSLDDVLSHIR